LATVSGLPDFSFVPSSNQSWKNGTKMATKIPNEHKTYQNGNKYTHEIQQAFPSQGLQHYAKNVLV
jgi:hypothetical protein